MTQNDSRTVTITLPDGSTSDVALYEPPGSPGSPATKPLVVVWPGFGMGARYYRPISEWLAERGYPTAVGELRGQGTSSARAARDHTWGYHALATEDYPLTIEAAKREFGLAADHPVVLLAHSMGGQIGTLFLANEVSRDLNVRGMLGVGVGSPSFRAFTGATRRRLLFGTTFMAVVSAVLGYWPGGKLDPVGYGRQARTHVREWARLSRTNEVSHIAGRDYDRALQTIRVPILYTRLNDDADCPIASAKALAQHVPAQYAAVEEVAGNLGHNRWARNPTVIGERFIRFCSDSLEL